MCEYCGCQAVASIDTLTREHEAVLNLVHAASKALALGRVEPARVICSELAAVLGPHSAVEEQALFPVMAEDFPDQIAALIADHDLIDEALSEVVPGRQLVEGWEVRLSTALALLPGHILREQDGVFPAALITLSPAEWDRLDAVREEQEALRHVVV